MGMVRKISVWTWTPGSLHMSVTMLQAQLDGPSHALNSAGPAGQHALLWHGVEIGRRQMSQQVAIK